MTQGEAEEDDPSAWVPRNHVRDPEKVPGSQLETDLALVTVAIWGMNQWIDFYSLSLTLLLSSKLLLFLNHKLLKNF